MLYRIYLTFRKILVLSTGLDCLSWRWRQFYHSERTYVFIGRLLTSHPTTHESSPTHTATASNLDKSWKTVLSHHKYTAEGQKYLPTIPTFLGGQGGGGCYRGLRGTRSLNMNKRPISFQSPTGASKHVYVLCSWVYGVSTVVKKMWGVWGWFCRETAVPHTLAKLVQLRPEIYCALLTTPSGQEQIYSLILWL